MDLANYLKMDPIMLFSLVNTKLRDDFDGDLDRLVSSFDLDKAKLIECLAGAGFEFLSEVGQFR
ncbi:DUF4250 domain-containing protein [Vibrio sp. RC27]